ncbi:hypothetical protein KY363_00165 [Candidatus Woesearchaeota archaeon]|nr:hypothetical protein [Candidatus Woesearchaeota archaeon]
MIFRKKKTKAAEEADLDDEDIIDFEEFEAIEDLDEGPKEDLKEEEVKHHFIFHIKDGCPICGSDVKGNDYFKYFCEKCNVLFDKKDILESEFGEGARKTGVRKTALTEEERAALEKKRKALSERIFRTFSEEQKEELREEAGSRDEQAEEEPAGPEEAGPEEVEAEVIPQYVTEEDEPVEEEEPKDFEDSLEHMQEEEQAEEPEEEQPEEEAEPEEEPEEKVEYDLEGEDKIIASRESDRMHVGTCHFVKKIHPDNRIYLESVEQGEESGYQLCVCLRRLRARTRLE